VGNCVSTYLIASVEAVMLLVNLQLATTSTVDGFQPVIEVAVTYKKKIFFLIIIEITYCIVINYECSKLFSIYIFQYLNTSYTFKGYLI
jgi:hypothetical protein